MSGLLIVALLGALYVTQHPQPMATPRATPSEAPPSVVLTLPPPTHVRYPQRILSIPALDVYRPIVEIPIQDGRWQIDAMGQDVGHLAGTAPFDGVGNAVLIGHITLTDNTYGPFINLAQLVPGDEVIVQHGAHRYIYRVARVRVVAPDDLSVVAPTDTPTLTLLTCTGWDVPAQRYTQRLIVIAHLVSIE